MHFAVAFKVFESKMKTKHSHLTSICVAQVVVFILTASSKSQGDLLPSNDTKTAATGKNDSDKLLMPVDTADQDFAVEFKGETLSLIKLLRLLRQRNITVPQNERSFLHAVFDQKQSSAQSCKGRCFLVERSDAKWCYCDTACKTWGDCCLDFHLRCVKTGNVLGETIVDNVTCGDINDPSWTRGVIMKSSCSLLNNENTNDCQTVQQLSMTLQQEMPVFDWNSNVTYRSIACARCNNGGKLSFWGLKITCSDGLKPPQDDITAVKRFVTKEDRCSWKYEPFSNLAKRYKSCVRHDSVCASNQLPVMSVVNELCSLYSMAFSYADGLNYFHYRNPHCALCNPEGIKEIKNTGGHGIRPSAPPLSILFDVSSNILNEEEPQTAQPPTQGYNLTLQSYNQTSQVFNCSSTMKNCTVTFGGKTCVLLTSLMNQTLNTSRVKMLTPKQFLLDKNAMKPKENTVFLLCPDHETVKYEQRGVSAVLSYITLTGTILSIISLCFLLVVYLSFKELRNLPGKCIISLSWALLFYQLIFLFVEKSKEVEALCKAVAICLHFFVLAAFSWMSVMAFDTANTFKVQVSDTRRQASDIKKTFIKYCIVGWGVPAMAVVGCAVLDFTGTLHFGYGDSFYCWIADKTALAVAMVTPVSLALVFNAVCLMKNLYVIHHLQQGAGLAATNTSRVSLLLICIKLTAVMGLTWILALIANWQQAAFLQYPSTLLNSMQGFFITLCFTTTKRVRCLLKEKIRKRCNRTAPRTSMTRRCTGSADTEIATGSTAFNITTQSRHGNHAGQSTS